MRSLLIVAALLFVSTTAHGAVQTASTNEKKKEEEKSSFSAFPPNINQDPTSVDWNTVLRVSKTTATLQVVNNPLLNPKTNPEVAKAWKYLKELNATKVRYQGWFPYPQWAVPELLPPNTTSMTTSWDFQPLMELLEPFMDSVQSAVLDMSTMPKWLFDSNWNVTWWEQPDQSNQVDWQYGNGKLQPNSTYLVSQYYGRLAKWLIDGWMIDEFGKNITGGPAYGVGPGSKLEYWEVMNEPDGELAVRGGTGLDYVAYFDEIVNEIRKKADPNHHLKFQGLVLAGHYEFDSWWKPFLNKANHLPSALSGINSASFHFYATPPHRMHNTSWSETLFVEADNFLEEVRLIVTMRDQMMPGLELAVDELGVILAGDNTVNETTPPLQYWNAANAMYTYVYAGLAEYGVDLAGCSQFAGVPVVPDLKIYQPQYPSVSMMNWSTMEPNARYWGLKLLIEEFNVGDQIVEVQRPKRNKICGGVSNHGLGGGAVPTYINLECPEPEQYIASIGKADMTDQIGTCDGGYTVIHGNCSDNGTVLEQAKRRCLGMQSCQINIEDIHYWFNGTKRKKSAGCYPYWEYMVVEAYCSGTSTGSTPHSQYLEDRVFLQGRITTDGKKKILFVNKNNARAPINFSPDVLAGASDATVRYADDDFQGIKSMNLTATEFTSFSVEAFSSGVIILN